MFQKKEKKNKPSYGNYRSKIRKNYLMKATLNRKNPFNTSSYHKQGISLPETLAAVNGCVFELYEKKTKNHIRCVGD